MCGIKTFESNMDNRNHFVNHSSFMTGQTDDVLFFCMVKGILAVRMAMEEHDETGLLKGLNEIAASLKQMKKEFNLMHGT
jgi:hypothetical protein